VTPSLGGEHHVTWHRSRTSIRAAGGAEEARRRGGEEERLLSSVQEEGAPHLTASRFAASRGGHL